MIEIKSSIKSDLDIEDFIRFAYTALGLTNDIVLRIYNDDYVLDRLAPPDCQLQALLHQTPLPHNYNLVVRNETDTPMSLVLSHEMIHLRQYEQGRLHLNIKTGVCNYDGKDYTASTRYTSRPWENEAFDRQYGLWKAYKKFRKDRYGA